MLKYLIFLCCFFSAEVFAKINLVLFEQLRTESSHIVYAESRAVNYRDDYSGFASLKVLDVFKGDYFEPNLVLNWSEGVHDRKIDQIPHKYILFLKKVDDGSFITSVYGAGIWVVFIDPNNFEDSVVRPDFVNGLPSELFDKKYNKEKISILSFYNFFNKKLIESVKKSV